ncbi:MAG: homogentisate 1,2-dioxygenase [Bacteroidetes bacterium]|nr:MAG: homogentisate 1,2-dioxygenase [Bacteroidota bacterium]
MPHYVRAGKIPSKRHVQFRKPDGGLYAEELVSTEGFSSLYSLVYHVHPPTRVKAIGEAYAWGPEIADKNNMQHRAYRGFDLEPQDDFLESRTYICANHDVEISLAAPRRGTGTYFYKNSQADEMLFIHRGSGRLRSMFGEIRFGYGDYLIVPRGVVYQIDFDDTDNRLLIMESASPITYPKRYLNNYGQLLEHAPFCERDIRVPENLQTHDEAGDFLILIKKQGMLFPYVVDRHPFGVVGWDGCFYPFAFSIHEFEPITGRVHQPPPVHQTFAGAGYVVCSFVPRLFDYHPEGIPAPYNHSNIDSDELLYYVAGNFMSRKGIDVGNITLHPQGIPHGPHPGTVEASIGKESTEELAVMIDTFRPLWLTKAATKLEMPDYYKSWIE